MPPARRPLADRFWPKVTKTDGCWLWTGAVRSGVGYGIIGLAGKYGGNTYAHRLAWVLTFGAIPEGLCVLHRCDNRLCVRPDHLFLGTRGDNAADMVSKGREAKGERVHSAKLTLAQIQELRRLRAEGVTFKKLAEVFGVCAAQAHRIAHRREWRHIT